MNFQAAGKIKLSEYENCLIVPISNRRLAFRLLEEQAKTDKLFDVEFKRHREKKSLKANNYCWELLGKLAEKLRMPGVPITPEEIYREMISKTEFYKSFRFVTTEEVNLFKRFWRKLGLGWFVEDWYKDGEFYVLRAYYGSSEYDSKQMNFLIDLIIEECKTQDIETLPPDKVALLKEDWKKKEEQAV